MTSITIEYQRLEGTAAAVGRAGSHTVVADRPEDKAGGMGLGFNGGQLLALALGGCFCNDVQYTAHEMGVGVSDLRVTVTIDLEGDPVVAKRAEMSVVCELTGGGDAGPLIERAKARCTVAHSLRAGLDVKIGRRT